MKTYEQIKKELEYHKKLVIHFEQGTKIYDNHLNIIRALEWVLKEDKNES